MKCMQQELLAILPPGLRNALCRTDPESMVEIRLRCGKPPRIHTKKGAYELPLTVSTEDLSFCINAASRYSPWNAASLRQGYLTAPGGHRIGLCGQWNGDGLQQIHSLCIRVAKDIQKIAEGISLDESILILGPPGSGKTTLLRDLIRCISGKQCIAVVDERQELFPLIDGINCFDPGPNTDVLSGCDKETGIEMVLRSMGPGWIAMDEITGENDCRALVRAGWCGVRLTATAHAASSEDLKNRAIYRPLIQTGLFRRAVVLSPDRQWHMEVLLP